MKGSHELSQFKRLYAAETGLKLRTAQLHAKTHHPDWVAFVARTGARALKGEATPITAAALVMTVEAGRQEAGRLPGPPALGKTVQDMSPEEYAEVQAWEGYMEATKQQQQALRTGNPMDAVGYVNISGNALKTYHLARQKRLQAEIEMGRLQPIGAWQSVKQALAKVAALIARIEEQAAAANPDNPMVARRALEHWKMNRFQPALQAMIEEIEGTIERAA